MGNLKEGNTFRALLNALRAANQFLQQKLEHLVLVANAVTLASLLRTLVNNNCTEYMNPEQAFLDFRMSSEYEPSLMHHATGRDVIEFSLAVPTGARLRLRW